MLRAEEEAHRGYRAWWAQRHVWNETMTAILSTPGRAQLSPSITRANTAARGGLATGPGCSGYGIILGPWSPTEPDPLPALGGVPPRALWARAGTPPFGGWALAGARAAVIGFLVPCPACCTGWCGLVPDPDDDFDYALAHELSCTRECPPAEIAWWHLWRSGELPP